ncbi:hypothetical protein [Humibacter sp.]|uniref:hypothetical protein n=1 Tax=Humibacter sp. TaxID=1940291 RepID=UPI002CDE6A4F|nr:hypothetical protein [Humibacter sp.]HVX07604.1 hypothetical protein [Humibacter sp.]
MAADVVPHVPVSPVPLPARTTGRRDVLLAVVVCLGVGTLITAAAYLAELRWPGDPSLVDFVDSKVLIYVMRSVLCVVAAGVVFGCFLAARQVRKVTTAHTALAIVIGLILSAPSAYGLGAAARRTLDWSANQTWTHELNNINTDDALGPPALDRPAADPSIAGKFMAPASLGAGWSYAAGYEHGPGRIHTSAVGAVDAGRVYYAGGSDSTNLSLVEVIVAFGSSAQAHAYLIAQSAPASAPACSDGCPSAGPTGGVATYTRLPNPALRAESFAYRFTDSIGTHDVVLIRDGSTVATLLVLNVRLPHSEAGAMRVRAALLAAAALRG